ncbi:trans-aconitate 2-methyltransferase [Geotalea uraniireducens]|uniref:Trans-aconitate 2-methyltransferase n=1 Tax=Geotalea uraniireducens TaxID=351604 RepID=A0ABM8EJG9_9BACT|nr:methyltransferase domain-containing protein [Geotalea uraniireducens]BDV42501.1 trans-aconitate 2-methyltransferase [Geotalea uraniireducens]
MPWQPEQYLKFQDERYLPFEDLFPLIRVRAGLSVVDLGCGNGELTRRLADRLPESTVLGVDSSPTMLGKAQPFVRPGLDFALREIAALRGTWDLVFSHAALHWLDDHRRLIPRLLALVRPGGQVAVQVPSNHRHLAHLLIIETASEEPFRSALGGWLRHSPVLEIDQYAELLHRAGGTDLTVFEKVYPHRLADADAIAEWTAGSTLVPYFERLPQELHEPFRERYRGKLRRAYPPGPVLYTFRRIFFAATVKGPDR